MEQRRKYKRAKKYFAINIVALDFENVHLRFDRQKDNLKFYDESGLDFSPQGIKIMCSKPLAVGFKIQMKILIPDEKKLNLINTKGNIVWFEPIKGKYKKYFMIGVKFEGFEKGDKKKIVRLWRKYAL